RSNLKERAPRPPRPTRERGLPATCHRRPPSRSRSDRLPVLPLRHRLAAGWYVSCRGRQLRRRPGRRLASRPRQRPRSRARRVILLSLRADSPWRDPSASWRVYLGEPEPEPVLTGGGTFTVATPTAAPTAGSAAGSAQARWTP